MCIISEANYLVLVRGISTDRGKFAINLFLLRLVIVRFTLLSGIF